MRPRDLIPIVLAAGCISGCTWLRESWPWGKDHVPVTTPSHVSPAEPEPADQAQATSTGQGEAEAAGTQSRPRTVRRQPAAAKAETPTTKAGPGLVIEQPVMLENVVPGLEPIGPMEDLLSYRLKPARRRSAKPGRPAKPPQPEPIQPQPTSPEPPARPTPEPLPPAAGPSEPTAQPPAEPVPPARPLPPHLLPEPQEIEYGKPEIVAASLLRVNDQFMTIDDVLRACRDELAALPAALDRHDFRQRAEQIIRKEIGNQVLEALIYAEARLRLTDQQTQLIDQEMADFQRSMIAESGGSEQKLRAVLARRGEDLEAMLKDRRRRLTIRMFLQQRFYPAVSIGRRDLWEYYDRNRSEFVTPKQVQMRLIAAPYEKFLPEGIDSPTEGQLRAAAGRARQTIYKAADQLKAGQDFAEVARKNSRGIKAQAGGAWPMMPAGSFRLRQIEQIAFSLEQGQVSDVIQTETGYYIVKAEKVQPERTVTFEEAQERIEQKLRDRQLRKLEQDYFQMLMKGAHVEQSERFLAVAVDKAVRRYRR